MIKNLQKDFKILLSIAAILLILGGVVWGLKSSNTSTTISSSNEDMFVEANKKYLEIKEWGVRIKLSPEIADLTYKISASGYAGFSTESLYKMGGMGCLAAEGALGSMIYSDSVVFEREFDTQVIKRVGNGSVSYNAPQDRCSTGTQELQRKQVNALSYAINSIELVR